MDVAPLRRSYPSIRLLCTTYSSSSRCGQCTRSRSCQCWIVAPLSAGHGGRRTGGAKGLPQRRRRWQLLPEPVSEAVQPALRPCSARLTVSCTHTKQASASTALFPPHLICGCNSTILSRVWERGTNDKSGGTSSNNFAFTKGSKKCKQLTDANRCLQPWINCWVANRARGNPAASEASRPPAGFPGPPVPLQGLNTLPYSTVLVHPAPAAIFAG
jgi:hypothetical protein